MGTVRQVPGFGYIVETRDATTMVPGYGFYRETQSAGGGNTVAPGVGELLVTGHAPTIVRTAHQTVAPGVGALLLTGYAPTIAQTSGQTVAPGVASLLVTGHAPVIVQTAHQIVSPGVGSLLVTGHVPTILRTSGVNIFPGVGALTLTGYAPTVARTAHQVVQPGVGAIQITGHAPTISQAAPPTDPRYARPTADVSAGAWTPSTGSSLYDMLDEATPDSSDYISTTTASTCEVRLGPVVDPGTSSGQAVRYQAWSDDGAGLTVYLMQGAAQIASWSHASLPTSPTVFEQFLSAAECDSITSYANLRLRFEKP